MKSIVYVLLCIVIMTATLDGLRDTFIADNPISYIKEISCILLFAVMLLIVLKRGLRFKLSFPLIFNFFFLFILLVTLVVTKEYNNSAARGGLAFGGWSVWTKVFVAFLLSNALMMLSKIYPDLFYRIPKFYIIGVLIYSLLTLLFITTGWVSLLPARNWYGRLSIGYPTMDSFVLICGCIFSFFFIHRRHIKLVCISIFSIVLVMQNTATGYFMITVLFLFMTLWLPRKWKILPPVILIGGLCIGYYAYTYWAENMGTFGALLTDKINGFILGNNTSSIDIRHMQIDVLLQDMRSSTFSMIFGKGGNEAFIVESQYYALFGFSGLMGLGLYSFLMIFYFIKWPVSFKLKTYYSHSFIILIMYAISVAGLIGFYLFPFVFIFAYLYAVYSTSESEHSSQMRNM
ncbi:hypothetical protein [Serratia fonticola]|uniref:hypothetical protein n=1 Tax=Serratia fonticola TaxID=47917 RepID=UPI0013766F4E|nr:hypothetical protein [Serratia fonticola]NCG54146.1 hypothetical protein [Serratia fonticola]